MERAVISLPAKVYVEERARNKTNQILESLHLGKKCTIFSSTSIIDFVKEEIVPKLSFEIQIIEPETNTKEYIEGISKNLETDFILAVGGGRIIDTAKYSASFLKKPWIAFPTIPSHDGVVSSRASISHKGMKISFSAEEPVAIIADLETLKKAPYRMIASGVGDMLSNITSVEDWRIANAVGKEEYNALIAELALIPARAVLQHEEDIISVKIHGLEILMWSLICSGFAMNIYGSSRPCSGSEHNFSHALDALGCKALHGEKVALGALIMSYLQEKDHEKIKQAMKKFNLPKNAEELKTSEDAIIKALTLSREIRDRYTILNKNRIDRDRAIEILKDLDIIA